MYQVFHATHLLEDDIRYDMTKKLDYSLVSSGPAQFKRKVHNIYYYFYKQFFYIFVLFLDFDKEIHQQDIIIRKFWNLKTFH